jgi:hypothetical protein
MSKKDYKIKVGLAHSTMKKSTMKADMKTDRYQFST